MAGHKSLINEDGRDRLVCLKSVPQSQISEAHAVPVSVVGSTWVSKPTLRWHKSSYLHIMSQ